MVAICTSWPASSTWNESDIVRITPTDWRATTRRVTNDRPLRMRSTSNRMGSAWSPRRMKYACRECTRKRSSTVAAAARRPCATIWPPYSPPHG